MFSICQIKSSTDHIHLCFSGHHTVTGSSHGAGFLYFTSCTVSSTLHAVLWTFLLRLDYKKLLLPSWAYFLLHHLPCTISTLMLSSPLEPSGEAHILGNFQPIVVMGLRTTVAVILDASRLFSLHQGLRWLMPSQQLDCNLRDWIWATQLSHHWVPDSWRPPEVTVPWWKLLTHYEERNN